MCDDEFEACWEALKPSWKQPSKAALREYWTFTDILTLWVFDITEWPEEEKNIVRASHGKTSYTGPHRDESDGWPEEAAFRRLCYKMDSKEVEGDRASLYNTFHADGASPPVRLDGVMYYSVLGDSYGQLKAEFTRNPKID